MHDDNEYFRSMLAADFWYLRRFHQWDYDPPEEPKDHRTAKSTATIDALKRSVGVQ